VLLSVCAVTRLTTRPVPFSFSIEHANRFFGFAFGAGFRFH